MFPGDSVGGLVGAFLSSAATNSYFDMKTPLDMSSPEGMTTTEMKTQSKYINWDFTGETVNGTEDLWSIDASGVINDGYPYLTSMEP